MDEKFVSDFPVSNQPLSAKTALNILGEIEIVIDVSATRLVECRKLRLDEVTSDEIKILERKLFKHFIQQLDAKQRVHPKDLLSNLHQFPSLSKLLTLAGVSASLANAMKKQGFSVEELMNLDDIKLDYTVKDLGGNTNDTEKLFSALSVLRKSSCESISDYSCNGSESSGSTGSDAFGPPGRINFDFPNAGEHKSRRQHSTEIPSTSSSVTPPSPTGGSHSSMDSDSAFATGRSQSSSPPGISLNVIPSTPSYSSSAPPPAITLGTPRKSLQQLLHPSSHDFTLSNKNISRDRFPSTGAKTVFNTSTAKLKPSKSTEFNVGTPKENLTFGFANLSGSNQSLASTASHSSPSITKQSKAQKKKNKRNLTVDTDKLDFISLSRSLALTRRGSSTISPEGNDSASPFSLRTPSTPNTPDLVGSSHSSLPSTPKTPKSNFKAVRKIFKMIGIKKMKRNKSSEHLTDPIEDLPPVQRKRSGTMPSPKTKLSLEGNRILPASHPSSVCSTPLVSPEMNSVFDTHKFNSSPRRTSLVDTDKTIVADDSTLTGNTYEDESGISESDDAVSNSIRQDSLIQSEEWDIRYDDLQIQKKIGSGRVGTVFRGYWHADVAIRVIDINFNDEEKLKAFKQEIGVFKKTRHENLELFMGSCVNPPHLAIVTSFCRGSSLYNCIREKKLTKDNRIKLTAQHIVQGMGYLHSKEIVHKDLKSKNIFVDGKRVVITGFGLIGLHAVAYSDSRKRPGYLRIPDGWLCYLAPELIRSLRPPFNDSDDVISTLPYTKMTDVFAFGTVWFELLMGSWPNEGLHPERIIWQVGSDTKYGLTHLQTAKESKDIVSHCWAFNPAQRPDFSDKGIMGYLDKLQNQMQRAYSSHPRRPPNRNLPIDRIYDGAHLRHNTPFATLHDLAE